MFNFDEPFYPRLARGDGERSLLKAGYMPPRDWLQEVRSQFVATVPRQIRSHLQNDGWQAYVSLWPADIPFNKHVLELGSDDDRSLPEHTGGMCSANIKRIFASAAHQSTYSRRIYRERIAVIVGNLRHEAAHAVAYAFGHGFFYHKFSELMRQDIIALGGYANMREHGLSYFTPNEAKPRRD